MMDDACNRPVHRLAIFSLILEDAKKRENRGGKETTEDGLAKEIIQEKLIAKPSEFH